MAEKTLSKEEWAQVEKALMGRYGLVKLQVDDRKVTLERALIKKNQMGIVVYVDGVWRGEWVGTANDCPEQRYLCPRDSFVYPAKQRAEMKKISKRRRKEWGLRDPDTKVRIFYPYWPNATAIRRHYQKRFTSIELIEVIGA